MASKTEEFTVQDLPPPYTPSPNTLVTDEENVFQFTNFSTNPETPSLDQLEQILEHNSHFLLCRTALRVSLKDSTEKKTFLNLRQEKNVTKFCAGALETVLLEAEAGQQGVQKVVTVYDHKAVLVGTIHIDCLVGSSAIVIEIRDKFAKGILKVAEDEAAGHPVTYKIIKTNEGEIGKIWEKSGKTNLSIHETLNIELKALLLVTTSIVSRKESIQIPIVVEQVSEEGVPLDFWDKNCGHVLYWSCWGFAGICLMLVLIATFTWWT